MNIPEKREVLNWIRNNQENQKKYNILKAKYVAAKLKDIEDVDVDVDVHFKKFNKKVRDKKKVNYISYSTAIVMIIALSIVFSNNYFGKSKETLKEKIPATIENSLVDDSFIETVTSKGDNEEVILSDGSKIILNVDSKLIYPKKFNDSIREVTLIGEAFFDIERDVNKPFIVNANEIKIKVLGTSFNVKSYSKDEKIETTLVTGKVELIKDQDNT
ncbi:MAG: FecR domain-containing protein, partial [Romboutsia sp.]|nr:FecR domain-containing protein [Romboutsia sp.]